MKCKACDKLLSDFESTRKIILANGKTDYPDLCNRCFKQSGIVDVAEVIEREDLAGINDFEEVASLDSDPSWVDYD